MTRLSGWCGEHGSPHHDDCRTPETCACWCHDDDESPNEVPC